MAYVGQTLVDATPEEALAAVVGYSTFNDLTSRRAQKLTSASGSSARTATTPGPLGPIVPAAEVGDLRDGPAGADPGQRRDRPGRHAPTRWSTPSATRSP